MFFKFFVTATVDFLSQPVTLRPRRQTINSIVAVSGIEVDKRLKQTLF